MFKALRISLLLVILIIVGANTWLTQYRSTEWKAPLLVAIHPINGDNSEKAERFIQRLQPDSFESVEQFFRLQADRHGVTVSVPVKVLLDQTLDDHPPVLPENKSMLSALFWSLRFRLWSWQVKRNSQYRGADVHLYVVYHDPKTTPVLQHSVGLQKGMAGIVNAFGDHRHAGSNKVVMAHELLHTLGATDKYDLATGLPIFPAGYAEPYKNPVYPQRRAEIMGGYIALSQTVSRMPESLTDVMVGPQTAREINWPLAP